MRIDPIVLIAVCSFWSGLQFGALAFSRKKPAERVPEQASVGSPRVVEGDDVIELDDFTVTGKPRKPTWRQRRKELEAAARTKRKRLEEWRD